MKIYWIKAQAPRRVLALAKHLGVEAQFIKLDTSNAEHRSAQYTALNPNMKAPTLVDGPLALWESAAIMAHLCIRQGSDMWPAHDPAEQVEVLRWISWDLGHWEPAVAPFYFEHVVKATFSLGPPDSASLQNHVGGFTRYAKVLDGHLSDRDTVACDRLTIADFQLASMACHWRESEMPMQDFPNIIRWLDSLDRIPAWSDPWPGSPG